jgi:hypothetical protein
MSSRDVLRTLTVDSSDSSASSDSSDSDLGEDVLDIRSNLYVQRHSPSGSTTHLRSLHNLISSFNAYSRHIRCVVVTGDNGQDWSPSERPGLVSEGEEGEHIPSEIILVVNIE